MGHEEVHANLSCVPQNVTRRQAHLSFHAHTKLDHLSCLQLLICTPICPKHSRRFSMAESSEHLPSIGTRSDASTIERVEPHASDGSQSARLRPTNFVHQQTRRADAAVRTSTLVPTTHQFSKAPEELGVLKYSTAAWPGGTGEFGRRKNTISST